MVLFWFVLFGHHPVKAIYWNVMDCLFAGKRYFNFWNWFLYGIFSMLSQSDGEDARGWGKLEMLKGKICDGIVGMG